MSSSEPVKEDFLEVDPEIPGQKFVCLSFVSPEEILKNKDVYFISEYFKRLHSNYKIIERADPSETPKELSFADFEEKWKDFLYSNQEELERRFYEENDFRTTMRALKVRGVYDSEKEAKTRAKLLQHRDKNFNVFIGQVGYWLPWDPNPHRIGDQEYMEEELNTLVKKYKENQESKDLHFQQNLDYVKEQAEKKAKAAKEEKAREAAGLSESSVFADGPSVISFGDDSTDAGYSVSVSGGDVKVNTDDATANTTETDTPTTSSDTPTPFNVVDSATRTALDAVDPWMARRGGESSERVNTD